MLITFLLYFLFCTCSSQSPDYDSCKMDSMTWNGEEVKKTILNIASFEECSQICKQDKEDGSDCKYFTWNNASHRYFQNTCMLFNEPVQKEECENCVSGASSCFCETPVACMDTGSNLVDIIPGLSWDQCQRRCSLTLSCSDFTSFTEDHIYKNLCILYSECSELDTTCSGCCSGHKTFNPCSSYLELYSPARRALSKDPAATSGKYGDTTKRGWAHLPDWTSNGTYIEGASHWYRFTKEAGTKMSQKFPGFNQCGSDEPIWMKVDKYNKLPSTGTGKTMKVCRPDKYDQKSCPSYKTKQINVMNCKEYFVYELTAYHGHTYCGSSDV